MTSRPRFRQSEKFAIVSAGTRKVQLRPPADGTKVPPPQMPFSRIRRAGAPSATVTRLPVRTGSAPLVRGARAGSAHASG